MTKRTFATLALLLFAAPALARNIDLSTVPTRDGVQLTIYNPADLTLVRETRTLVFRPGMNPLQFSWANTLIDPTSVQLAFVTHADALHLADTTFPHDRPQLLQWNVEAGRQLEATVEISYFTSGIRWSADYVGIATPDEKSMALTGYVRVDNRSGEQYDNAQVRLVVGTINLVEKIAELAQRTHKDVAGLDLQEQSKLKREALTEEMKKPQIYGQLHMSLDFVDNASVRNLTTKKVEKAALSEYFIYTVEGTETIPDGWAKRLQSFTADAVPLSVRHRYRVPEYGDQLVRLFVFSNDAAAGLGTTPLPDGSWRLFRRNGDDSLSYLATVQRQYVPIGDKVELNLGADPAVVFEQVAQRSYRDNIWMRYSGGNVTFKLGDPKAKLQLDSEVHGWDEHQLLTQRIANHGERPIEVEVRRSYDGDVLFRSQLGTRLFDFRTVEFNTTVAPGERKTLRYEVVKREQNNANQQRVELEERAPAQ